MNTIILNFIATAFLSAIVQLLMPKNQNSKYISFIFGLILISIVVRPISTIKNVDFTPQFTIDSEDYQQTTNTYVDTAFSNNLAEYIKEEFDTNASVTVENSQVQSIVIEDKMKIPEIKEKLQLEGCDYQ